MVSVRKKNVHRNILEEYLPKILTAHRWWQKVWLTQYFSTVIYIFFLFLMRIVVLLKKHKSGFKAMTNIAQNLPYYFLYK